MTDDMFSRPRSFARLPVLTGAREVEVANAAMGEVTLAAMRTGMARLAHGATKPRR
jgi:hypothetical protein